MRKKSYIYNKGYSTGSLWNELTALVDLANDRCQRKSELDVLSK